MVLSGFWRSGLEIAQACSGVLPDIGKIQNATAACGDTAETALAKRDSDALRAMPACKCGGLIRPSPKDAL